MLEKAGSVKSGLARHFFIRQDLQDLEDLSLLSQFHDETEKKQSTSQNYFSSKAISTLFPLLSLSLLFPSPHPLGQEDHHQ
jgi:hypothetical protein